MDSLVWAVIDMRQTLVRYHGRLCACTSSQTSGGFSRDLSLVQVTVADPSLLAKMKMRMTEHGMHLRREVLSLMSP